jgi:putative membrane protein
MMAWYWHAQHGGPGLWPWLWVSWMVLFWGGLLAAGVYFLRRRPARTAGPSAEEVLAERYARGEIDAEEYRQRRVVLREREQRGRTS